MKTITITGLLAAAGLILLTATVKETHVFAAAATEPGMSSAVDAAGDLLVPKDYRTTYQFLGSWAIASDKGAQGSKGLHVVYASPGAIDAYRKSGQFPDGSVLIKEVYQATTQTMTTGTVSRADKLTGWFEMVKESKNLHPGMGTWGDGWAWSWFDAGNPTKTTTTNYKLQCLTCHEPARPKDLVYVEGYPPLLK